MCSDGAAAMTGKISGVTALIKQKAPHVVATHCMLHREALVAKRMDNELNQKLARQRKAQYRQLSERIDREKKMFVISQKIQTRKDLQDKTKKVKVRNETPTAPAIYRFEAKRKR